MRPIPSWGVVVRCDVQRARSVATQTSVTEGAAFKLDDLAFSPGRDWTGVFCMVPAPTDDRMLADAYRRSGLEAVHLDFYDEGESTSRWNVGDGEWEVRVDEDPYVLCEQFGIQIPRPEGSAAPVQASPVDSLNARAIGVLVGIDDLNVATSLLSRPRRLERGPKGTLVHDFDVTRDIPEESSATFLEVSFHARPGAFRVTMNRGEECLGTFVPGAIRTWDGTPFLDNIHGGKSALEVVDALGIKRSFLDPDPPLPPNTFYPAGEPRRAWVFEHKSARDLGPRISIKPGVAVEDIERGVSVRSTSRLVILDANLLASLAPVSFALSYVPSNGRFSCERIEGATHEVFLVGDPTDVSIPRVGHVLSQTSPLAILRALSLDASFLGAEK